MGTNIYISILRGINVSGKNPVKMDALRALYDGLGFENVTTYIQSGNVIFKSRDTDAEALARLISDRIAEQFKIDVPVIVLKSGELRNILNNDPFANDQKKDPERLHITFLSAVPDSKLARGIAQDPYLPDEFSISGKAVYLYCPEGYGKTKLNNNFFEKKLKVTATTRNLRTLRELLRISGTIK